MFSFIVFPFPPFPMIHAYWLLFNLDRRSSTPPPTPPNTIIIVLKKTKRDPEIKKDLKEMYKNSVWVNMYNDHNDNNKIMWMLLILLYVNCPLKIFFLVFFFFFIYRCFILPCFYIWGVLAALSCCYWSLSTERGKSF